MFIFNDDNFVDPFRANIIVFTLNNRTTFAILINIDDVIIVNVMTTNINFIWPINFETFDWLC